MNSARAGSHSLNYLDIPADKVKTALMARPATISREQIVIHARRLFEERGADATSVALITDTAGIAKGSFYVYFKNKNELLNEIFIDYLSSFETLVVERIRSNPRIKSFSGSLFDFFSGKSLFLNELRRELHDNSNLPHCRKALEELTELVSEFLNIRPDYPIHDLRSYSRIIVGTLFNILHGHIIEGLYSGDTAREMIEDSLKRYFSCEDRLTH